LQIPSSWTKDIASCAVNFNWVDSFVLKHIGLYLPKISIKGYKAVLLPLFPHKLIPALTTFHIKLGWKPYKFCNCWALHEHMFGSFYFNAAKWATSVELIYFFWQVFFSRKKILCKPPQEVYYTPFRMAPNLLLGGWCLWYLSNHKGGYQFHTPTLGIV
jgi:hypothetical protein